MILTYPANIRLFVYKRNVIIFIAKPHSCWLRGFVCTFRNYFLKPLLCAYLPPVVVLVAVATPFGAGVMPIFFNNKTDTSKVGSSVSKIRASLRMM
jgi:hypothetical protein